jgi:hypothetical protein
MSVESPFRLLAMHCGAHVDTSNMIIQVVGKPEMEKRCFPIVLCDTWVGQPALYWCMFD